MPLGGTYLMSPNSVYDSMGGIFSRGITNKCYSLQGWLPMGDEIYYSCMTSRKFWQTSGATAETAKHPTMTAINHEFWYDGTPASIGRDTTVEQWGEHMHHIIQNNQEKQGGRIRATICWALGDANGQI